MLGPRDVWLLALLALVMISPADRGPRRPARAMRWSDADMRDFVERMSPIGIPLGELLAMLCSESGLDPAASSGSAFGLNQAQGPLLRTVGWTAPAPSFASLSVAEQLPWVARMLRAQCRAIGYVPRTGGELYRANLSPKAAASRADVIYRRDVPSEAKLYNGNRGLDREGKGSITLADLEHALERVKGTALYRAHLAQLERLRKDDHGSGK